VEVGCSLTTLRRAGARAGGRFYMATAPASGNSASSIVFTATGALGSTLSQNALVDGYYLYLPAAAANDKVRVVASYTASSGTVVPDRAWSGATVPDEKVVELHGLCWPYSDDLTTYSWTDAINDCLKRIWLTVEFTITPTAGAIRHSLASQTWLRSFDQVLDVGILQTSETRANVDPYRHHHLDAEGERDGATLYLNHSPRTFATNERIYVRAAKRAYDHCRASGGSFGSQSGLVLETDEAPVCTDAVTWGSLVEIARNTRNELSDAAGDHIKSMQDTWAHKWNTEQQKALEDLPPRRFRRRLSFYANRW
jgi:hypothetical protein